MVVTETLTSHPDQADFDANRAFWSGQAAAAKAAKAARQELFALKGQTLVVVKGRKVAHGTSGVCFYSGEGKFGWRVGFETAAGETVWTDVRNVKVVETVEVAHSDLACDTCGKTVYWCQGHQAVTA